MPSKTSKKARDADESELRLKQRLPGRSVSERPPPVVNRCRICLEMDETSSLIAPCSCKGTQKYVHPECLRKWQISARGIQFSYTDERAIRCSVCLTYYTSANIPVSLRGYFYTWTPQLLRIHEFTDGMLLFLTGFKLLLPFLYEGSIRLSVWLEPIIGMTIHRLLWDALSLVLLLVFLALICLLWRVVLRPALSAAIWMGIALATTAALDSDVLLRPHSRTRGSLLVASPHLDGTDLESALILVSEHSTRGASGLILNLEYQDATRVGRIIGAAHKFKLWRPFSSEYHGGLTSDQVADVTVVYGPVRNQPVDVRIEDWLLRRPEPPSAVQRWRDAAALAGEESAASGSLLMGRGTRAPLRVLLHTAGVSEETTQLYYGTCSWGPDQLEGELRSGDWGLVNSAKVGTVINSSPQELLHVLSSRQRIAWYR